LSLLDRDDPSFTYIVLFNEWLDQLSLRRAVWCWAVPSDPAVPGESFESVAMWNSYAKSGVAIRTSIGSVLKAVEASSDLKSAEGIAIRVEYARQGYPISEITEDGVLKRPFHPFGFKNKSYDYENEVRIVFRMKEIPKEPGITVDIDTRLLLEGGEVVISPYIQREEAEALVEVIGKMLNNSSIKVRRSTERQESLHESSFEKVLRDFQNQWLKPFEPEEGLPALLREL
jgi:hypothetical protein